MTIIPSAKPSAPRPKAPRKKRNPTNPADTIPPAEYWRNADDMRWSARHWSVRIGVNLRSIHIRPMTTKWASISTAGRLTLDASLLTLPRDLGEFVIVHELVHLLCPEAGHGRVFKSFLLAYLPDWEERERRLQGREEKKKTSQEKAGFFRVAHRRPVNKGLP